MPTQKAPARAPSPAPPPERVELLTVEAHPILGRTERWRMSDGTVQSILMKAVWVE